MKKLVLVMVCTLLMAIFIGFNYLLWDKENREKDIQSLQDSNAYNNATVNALSRDIKQLEDQNGGLNARINELEFNNKLLTANNQNLTQDNLKARDDLTLKNDMISALKKSMDLSMLELPIKKWADSINKGDYQAAYSLFYSKYLAKQESISDIFKFTEVYKSSVKNIEIKSTKLYEDEMSEEERGNVVFDVVVNVKKTGEDKDSSSEFKEGSNRCFFTIIYDAQRVKWVISNIIVI